MDRWTIQSPGTLRWDASSDPAPEHADHIEMAGQRCAMVVRYGLDAGRRLRLEQTLVFPALRTIPNNTHASLLWPCSQADMLFLESEGRLLPPETVDAITFDGVLRTEGHTDGLFITRALLPSREGQYAVEQITVRNDGPRPRDLRWWESEPSCVKGCHGVYVKRREILGEQGLLPPGGTRVLTACYTAAIASAPAAPLPGADEIALRQSFVSAVRNSLILETPDEILNNAFTLAKLRAAESVFRTRSGLLHAPGGLHYYAAVWTNDQVEYANPLFPWLGEPNAIESAKNALELYIPFMSGSYLPIPSSIIAEGLDIWEGAGDRGDAAMYASGASRFLLALGDRAYAEKILPAVEWCLEYCKRRTTPEGVVASDSDELENRFSSGDANLATSCLAYDGLRHAAALESALGREDMAQEYLRRGDALEGAIEAHFGATVEGFDTYRYHAGCERLRAWICLPLAFGIRRRQAETIRGLFSERLWMPDGLATESGGAVFWDRSTLYALRSVLSAGEADRAMEKLRAYSRRRTLGEHVPYPVEAWPEGDQRHLSAESALYCRVYTEGLFGLEPTGLDSFRLTPALPEDWDGASLRNVHACGRTFDLAVTREDGGYTVAVSTQNTSREYRLPRGGTAEITFA